jgi:hypothetical protein
MASMQNKQKSAILPVREQAKDKLFILRLENLPHGERFVLYSEKNLSPCGNLSWTRTGLGAKRRTLYNIKNEKF